MCLTPKAITALKILEILPQIDQLPARLEKPAEFAVKQQENPRRPQASSAGVLKTIRLIAGLTWLLLKALFALIFFATPVMGFWLASSLAAYFGGPQWVAWTAGAFLFPIIPGAWEFYDWTHRSAESKPWFTPFDRLCLRTFGIGLAFIAVLLCIYPQTAFVALSTRGDWMLEGVKDPRVESARRVLFASAGGIEWLYNATKTNPYKALIDPKARQRSDEAAKEREQETTTQHEEKIANQHDEDEIEQKGTQKKVQQQDENQQEIAQQPVADGTDGTDGTSGTEQPPKSKSDSVNQDDHGTSKLPEKTVDEKPKIDTATDTERQTAKPVAPKVHWPYPKASLHPAVANMPASAEKSIESVARYIAKQEHDPVMRIKALHDYVADRIAYDYPAYRSGNIPPQDAETTFKTRKSVCAGYANLLSALADVIHEKIVVVEGNARHADTGDKLTGAGHAWNAARIGRSWYLIDACWDSGSCSPESGFTKQYSTDYFLTPPQVMIANHFPDNPTWQLLPEPLSQGDFLRRPLLTPNFEAQDLQLVAPARARTESGSKVVVIVKNPKKRWLMAGLEQDGKELQSQDNVTNSETSQLECLLPDKGTYRCNLFMNPQSRYGRYEFVGSVDFVRR